MSSKFQPGEEMFDDVEGHGIRGKGLVEDTSEDTEGHGLSARGLAKDADDVEGHMPRIKIALPQERTEDDQADEDTEGHGVRVRFALPQERTEDDDDVEGHASRGKV